MAREQTLFAFQAGVGSFDWECVNDGVTSGVSASDFQLLPGGGAVFCGNVSLDNRGGFASVRARRAIAAPGLRRHRPAAHVKPLAASADDIDRQIFASLRIEQPHRVSTWKNSPNGPLTGAAAAPLSPFVYIMSI